MEEMKPMIEMMKKSIMDMQVCLAKMEGMACCEDDKEESDDKLDVMYPSMKK